MKCPRLWLLFCIVAFVPLAAAQQAPLLRIRVLQEPGQPGLAIVADNDYTSPAVEYIVAHRYYNPYDNRNLCPPAWRDQHGQCVSLAAAVLTLPHLAPPGEPDPLEIPARGSRQIGGYGSAKTRIVSETCDAVIYADGAMAGAPSMLDQLLFDRRRNLADLEQDVDILTRLQGNPDTDWALVARKFTQRARRHDKLLVPTLNGGAAGSLVFPHPLDEICRHIAESLAAGEGAGLLLRELDLDIAQLQASQPPIDASGNR